MTRFGRGVARVAGALLIAVSFVPVGWLFGPSETPLTRQVAPTEWLLGLFVFGAIAWLIVRLFPSVAALPAVLLVQIERRLKGGLLNAALLAALGLVLLVVSAVVFQHRPLLVDSVVQLYQAKIFAAGSLTAPGPPGEAFVATQHMLIREGRWFAQYPPGHSALLALGVLAGAVWAVPILLSLGSALLLHRFATTAWDERTGRAVLALMLFAPFFWLMGASFMNHVTCLFFVALFLVGFQRWEAGGGAGWALAAGLAIGAAGLARPLTAVAVAAVFAPIGLRCAIGRRSVLSVALAAAGGLFAAALYMGWNVATTGDALVPGYLELWGSAHGIGFHLSPWGEAHTPWTGLRNELLDLALLSSAFLEWPIPALLPAGLYLAATGGRDGWDRRMIIALLAIPAVYLFYWHRDAYLGPRFLYTGLLFLVPLTARGLLALPNLPAGRWRIRQTATLVVVLSFAYTAFYAAPRRVLVYGSSLGSMKLDLPALARDAGIEHGVVFVAVSWGNRLLARMRGAGVGASAAETVYRRADHCDVERLLRLARARLWDGSRTEAALAALPRSGMALGVASPNGDPTLRLVPGRGLAPVCQAELSHDMLGYGNWLPFLLANDPALESPVLFVRDLRDLNLDFLTVRPGRAAWLYRPSGFVRLESGAPRSRPTSPY